MADRLPEAGVTTAQILIGFGLNRFARGRLPGAGQPLSRDPRSVGPLLGFVRPTERLQRVLIWEGSLIDPVGGILGALVFHAVSASTSRGPGSQLAQFW